MSLIEKWNKINYELAVTTILKDYKKLISDITKETRSDRIHITTYTLNSILLEFYVSQSTVEKNYDILERNKGLLNELSQCQDSFLNKFVNSYVNQTFIDLIQLIIKLQMFKSYGVINDFNTKTLIQFFTISLLDIKGEKIGGRKQIALREHYNSQLEKKEENKQNYSEQFTYVQTGEQSQNLQKIRQATLTICNQLTFNLSSEFVKIYKTGLAEVSGNSNAEGLTYFEQEEYVLQNILSQKTVKDFLLYQFFSKDILDPIYQDGITFSSENLQEKHISGYIEELTNIGLHSLLKNYIKRTSYVTNLMGRKLSTKLQPKDKVYIKEIIKTFNKFKKKITYMSNGSLYEFREYLQNSFKNLVLIEIDYIWQAIFIKMNQNKDWIEEFRKDRDYILENIHSKNNKQNEPDIHTFEKYFLSMHVLLTHEENKIDKKNIDIVPEIYLLDYDFLDKFQITEKLGLNKFIIEGKTILENKVEAWKKILNKKASEIDKLTQDSLLS